jgi:hypothetical protein
VEGDEETPMEVKRVRWTEGGGGRRGDADGGEAGEVEKDEETAREVKRVRWTEGGGPREVEGDEDAEGGKSREVEGDSPRQLNCAEWERIMLLLQDVETCMI